MDGVPFLATQPKLRFQGLPAPQPYPQNPLDDLLLGNSSQQSSLEGLPHMHSPYHQRPMGPLTGSPFPTLPTRAYPLHDGARGLPPSPFCAAALLQPGAAALPTAAVATTAGQLWLAPLPFPSPEPGPQDPLPDSLELLEVLTSLDSSLSQVDSSGMVSEPMAVQLPDDILAWAACRSATAGSPHHGAGHQIHQQPQHCLQQPSLAPAVGTTRQPFVGRVLPKSSAAAPRSSTYCSGCAPVHGGQLAALPFAAGSRLTASTPTTPVQHTQQLLLPHPTPVLGQLDMGSGACFDGTTGALSSCPLPRELENLELDLDGLDFPELDLGKRGGLLLAPQEGPAACLATPPSRKDSGCLRQTSCGVPMLLPQYELPATCTSGAVTLCMPLAGLDLPLAAYPTADQAVSPLSATALCAIAAPPPAAAQPWPQPHRFGHSHTTMAGSGTACGAACSMLGKRRRSWGQLVSASASHELEASLEGSSTAEGPAPHSGAGAGHASSPSGGLGTTQAQQAQRRRVAWEQYELDEAEVAAVLEPVRTLPRISEAPEDPGSESAGASATSAGHSCPPAAAVTCIKAGVDPPSEAPCVTFLLPPFGGGPPQPTQCAFLFQKQLTSSDTGRLGRIVLPSVQAHKWFPDISDKSGLDFWFLDSEGGEHCVTFKYWQNGKPHKLMYLFEGTRAFCTNKHLKAGSHLAFYCTPAGSIVVDTVAVEARGPKQA